MVLSETFPQNVEFVPVREAWNKYRCEDGVTLKGKITLRRITIIKKDEEGKKPYNFEFNSLTETDTPPKIFPSEGVSLRVSEQVEVKVPDDLVKEVKFEHIEDVSQIYETKKMLLVITEKMGRIWLTKKIDSYGRPVYHCELTVNIMLMARNPPDTQTLKEA